MAGNTILINGVSGAVTATKFSATAGNKTLLATGQTGKQAIVVYYYLNASANASYGSFYYPDGVGGYNAITDRIYVNLNEQNFRGVGVWVAAPVGEDLYWGSGANNINGIIGIVFV